MESCEVDFQVVVRGIAGCDITSCWQHEEALVEGYMRSDYTVDLDDRVPIQGLSSSHLPGAIINEVIGVVVHSIWI